MVVTSPTKTILFTCCTGGGGNVGGRTLRSFIDQTASSPESYVIRIGMRSPDKAKKALADVFEARNKVEVVKLDLSDPETYQDALHGVSAVFLGQPDSGGMDTKELMETFIEKATTVQPSPPFVVRLVAGSTKPAIKEAFDSVGCPLFEPHFRAYEVFGQARKENKLKVTFVDACSWFFQNYTSLYVELVAAGFLAVPNDDARLPYIDTRDIGDYAAGILLNQEKYQNKDMTLTGAYKMTTSDWAAMISDELGHSVKSSTDETLLREEFRKIPIGNDLTMWDFMQQFYQVERLISEADSPLDPTSFEEVTGQKHRDPRAFCKEMAKTGIWSQSSPVDH